MFDSLKSKLKNVFKKAPAEVADSPETPVEEKTPANKTRTESEHPHLSDGFFAKKIKEESLDDMLWELEIALLEADVALPVVEEIKEGVKENLLGKKYSRGHSLEEIVEFSIKDAVR